jgi:Glycosyl hydrolase family 26
MRISFLQQKWCARAFISATVIILTSIHSIAVYAQSNQSADGSVLFAGSWGNLVTSAGTWTFNSSQGAGGNEILVNGGSAGGGSADWLYVENGGQVYALNSASTWYLWGGSGWSWTTSPLSPDGSALNAGSGGSLITKYGIWTLSSSSGTGGYEILLQGGSAGGGYANSLYVENGGQVYALNSLNSWYLWSGSSWIQVNEPSTLNSGVTPTSTSVQTYQAETGRNANVVNMAQPWGTTTGTGFIPFDFPVGSSSACCTGPWASSVAASAPNTIPMITWEPLQAGGFNSAFCPASIAAGASDAFIQEFASEVAGWGAAQVAAGQSPLLFLRLMHEMNVAGWEWSVQVASPCGYTTAAQFIAAWQHIYNIFQAQGATNAKFVWCIGNNSSIGYMDAYPGDAYVDYAAIDGYNWGSEYYIWQTFNQVFSATYAAITAVTSKPIIIAEWASVEAGSGDPPGVSKAAWITDAFNQLLSGNYPQIEYEVWFDQNNPGNPDWLIDTSSAAEAAFATAVSQISQ